MRKFLFIISAILITSSVQSQTDSNKESVSFDKILEKFQETKGWNLLAGEITDSVSKSCLYKTKEFSVSISEKPINLEIDTIVISNPYYTDDFDDWDDNYINFPKSFSTIYKDNLISLFDNGKFVCHNLKDNSRNEELENNLNAKRFKYHWVVDGKLFARTKSILFSNLYRWNGQNWENSDIKIPVKNQPILFSDENYIIYRECDGEFGGTIFFYNRQSKNTFYTESTCANTVWKENGQYLILSHLGHMQGTSEIKKIDNPTRLAKASRNQLRNSQGDLGYQDESNAFSNELELYGIQFFSTFKLEDRRLYLVNLNENTFLAEMDGKEIKIVNPLLNNDKYTHDPITKTYGDYKLINMDFYHTAKKREVTLMIIKDGKVTLLDWNENHSS
ncbi:hypothetical protein [uncultured Christiangramia sp.]|uniref:hypothetical protein n=1 Tax=uncultured Christiangramia sp. TaxID=503836 RepID=UPI00262B2402|nr:hypothetical protein [uncultured Christiangramia sp.]